MTRPLVIAVIGAVVLAAALIVNFFLWPGDDEAAQQVAKPVTDRAVPGGQPSAATGVGLSAPERAGPRGLQAPPEIRRSTRPSFDIVRIGPDGNAVIAGRAVPGAEVTVLDAGKPIGKVVADTRGEWVLVPSKPLPPGARKLSLRAKAPNGAVEESESEVVLVVPEAGRDVAGRKIGRPSGAIALKVPKSRPGEAGPGPAGSVVLQRPAAVAPAAGPSNVLTVDVVDYDRGGRVRIGGSARPDASLRLYLDDEVLGDARADAKGRWSFRPSRTLPPGTYRLRVDELKSGGRVARRIEIPFQRAAAIAELSDRGIAVVQPGNSLWGIARSTYGQGFQFTLIYEANKEQIRDPDLIYPGQIFTLPKPAPVN